MNKKIFWNDDLLVCKAVVGVFVTLAPAQAVPVVPNFTQETNDDSHRDNIKR